MIGMGDIHRAYFLFTIGCVLFSLIEIAIHYIFHTKKHVRVIQSIFMVDMLFAFMDFGLAIGYSLYMIIKMSKPVIGIEYFCVGLLALYVWLMVYVCIDYFYLEGRS